MEGPPSPSHPYYLFITRVNFDYRQKHVPRMTCYLPPSTNDHYKHRCLIHDILVLKHHRLFGFNSYRE